MSTLYEYYAGSKVHGIAFDITGSIIFFLDNTSGRLKSMDLHTGTVKTIDSSWGTYGFIDASHDGKYVGATHWSGSTRRAAIWDVCPGIEPCPAECLEGRFDLVPSEPPASKVEIGMRTSSIGFSAPKFLRALRLATPSATGGIVTSVTPVGDRRRALLQTDGQIDVQAELYYQSSEDAQAASESDFTPENVESAFAQENLDTPVVTSPPVVSNVTDGAVGCPQNQYLDTSSGMCKACPTGATSPAGSLSSMSCLCGQGLFYDPVSESCSGGTTPSI